MPLPTNRTWHEDQLNPAMQKELGESWGNKASLFFLFNLRAGTIKDVS
jgi:hypothetical protein